MKNSTARKLKEIPSGYLVMGIDPHKKKHAAVAMTQNLVTHTRFKFSNSREGCESMLQKARVEMIRTESHGVILAIETDGHY